MIDILSVVFEEELPVLQCQAQSIGIYCKDLDVNKIHVVVNDHNRLDIDRSWWGDMSDRVEIIPREMFSMDWSVSGWVNQQVLKILGSARSSSTWTVILDAKTIFTKPITKSLLFDLDGRARFGWMHIAGVFSPAKEIANQLIDIENDNILAPAGVPFLFHNQSVRSLVDYCESQTGQDFVTWFLEQGNLTEFVLYSTWIKADPLRQELYAEPPRSSEVLAVTHICHSTVDHFDNILADHGKHGHTLSIHRRAWIRLSNKQKEAFRDRLIACGIDKAVKLL